MNAFVDENDRGWKLMVRSTSTTSTNDTRTTAEGHLQIRIDGMVWYDGPWSDGGGPRE